jgi:hypothetical protein
MSCDVLRDQLLGELKEVNSVDAAAIWARRILPAKNSLNIADALQLENAFEERLAALKDARPSRLGSMHKHARSRTRRGSGWVRPLVSIFSTMEVLVDSDPLRSSVEVRQVPVGKTVWFSVRADLMNTGNHESMANRIDGKYIASEFLGSLETDVFEVAARPICSRRAASALPGLCLQGPRARDDLLARAESGVLLEDTRRPADLDAA